MDCVEDCIKTVREYVKNSVRLVRRCTKPDNKGSLIFLIFTFLEFSESAFAVGIGVFVMGFTAYLVKLVHIPINRLIVG